MTLVTFSLIAVGVASTLFSIVLIMVIISFMSIYKRLQKILDQLEVMAHTGLETSRMVHNYVEHVSASFATAVKQFVTLRGATELVSYIGDAIKNARRGPKNHEEVSDEPRSK